MPSKHFRLHTIRKLQKQEPHDTEKIRRILAHAIISKLSSRLNHSRAQNLNN
jgi:hypothetical protein